MSDVVTTRNRIRAINNMYDIRKLLKEKIQSEDIIAEYGHSAVCTRRANQQLVCVNKMIEEVKTQLTPIMYPELDQLNQRVTELEASNKQLREIICEFAHYLACPAYVFGPETVKTIIDIAAEERSRK